MIQFFRKIRHKLLKEGNVTRYLLYAIGEIALVMVGILLALQVNNWNESKKARIKEYHALSEILSDLEICDSSIQNLLYEDEFNITVCQNSLDLIISVIENEKVFNDSLGRHFINIFNYPDVDLKTSGYESLTSIGMDLISDNQIRSEIGKYFTFIVPKLNNAHMETRDDFYNYMLYFMRTQFEVEIEEKSLKSLTPIDFDELMRNKEFTASLKIYLSVHDYYRLTAEETLNETKKLKGLIENGLNKLNQ